MKAERRQELKTNVVLPGGLGGLPYYWREYGSRILLIVLVGATVYLLMRYWNEKKAQQAEKVAVAMQTVNVQLQQLDQFPLLYFNMPATALADSRQKLSQTVDQAIDTLLNSSSDPKVLASAYLAQGDLNWKLANLPELPGADTQPSLRMNRDSLLQQAAAAYQKVLEPKYAISADDVFAAHLGLAAIAENQQQWDKAKEQYQAIADAAGAPASFKEYARDRIGELPGYEKPALIGPRPVVTQPTPPTFGPLQPSSTTQPTTQHAAATRS